LSCPVVTSNGDLIGSISVIDIVLFTMNLCHSSQELVQALGLPIENDSMFTSFDNVPNLLRTDLALQKCGFGVDKVAFLTNFSRRNQLHVLPATTMVSQIASILKKSHRIAIGDVKLENYITQSEMVKFLFTKKMYYNGSKTVKELNIGTKIVITINRNERVIEAFKKMIIHKISGVGVVDDQGKLVGVVSAHDVRTVGASIQFLDSLYHSFDKYRECLQLSFKVPSTPITVSPSDTMDHVISTMIDNNVHRVFIVQEEKLSGVISFGDVLEKMLAK